MLLQGHRILVHVTKEVVMNGKRLQAFLLAILLGTLLTCCGNGKDEGDADADAPLDQAEDQQGDQAVDQPVDSTVDSPLDQSGDQAEDQPEGQIEEQPGDQALDQPEDQGSECQGCTGTSAACENAADSMSCDAQTGCAWAEAQQCTGSLDCGTLDSVNLSVCETCCDGRVSFCIDIPDDCACAEFTRDCSVFTSESVCTTCSCTWTTVFSCSGAHHPCDTYLDQTTCNSQQGCSWSTDLCSE